MYRICFITTARSEYGLLKWTMKKFQSSPFFKLQLVVTGGHLLFEQGHTIDTIINDGFKISDVVDVDISLNSTREIAESIGRMAEKIATTFEKLKPDLIVILGDRYELLPICNTALIMRIPICHISGGDVTDGAIDNNIRNSITMFADYHFPGTIDSANNIISMKKSEKNVWVVGEPGLDLYTHEVLLNRIEISDILSIDKNKKWCLFTYHPETKNTLEYNINVVVDSLNSLIKHEDLFIIATYSNIDFGGIQINSTINDIAKKYPNKIFVSPSLGNQLYLSVMKESTFVIGNSSSGIVESPFLNIPVINIGNRQKGRYLCKNIIQCDTNLMCINKSILEALSYDKVPYDKNYWGDGHTCDKIYNKLMEVFYEQK